MKKKSDPWLTMYDKFPNSKWLTVSEYESDVDEMLDFF